MRKLKTPSDGLAMAAYLSKIERLRKEIEENKENKTFEVRPTHSFAKYFVPKDPNKKRYPTGEQAIFKPFKTEDGLELIPVCIDLEDTQDDKIINYILDNLGETVIMLTRTGVHFFYLMEITDFVRLYTQSYLKLRYLVKSGYLTLKEADEIIGTNTGSAFASQRKRERVLKIEFLRRSMLPLSFVGNRSAFMTFKKLFKEGKITFETPVKEAWKLIEATNPKSKIYSYDTNYIDDWTDDFVKSWPIITFDKIIKTINPKHLPWAKGLGDPVKKELKKEEINARRHKAKARKEAREAFKKLGLEKQFNKLTTSTMMANIIKTQIQLGKEAQTSDLQLDFYEFEAKAFEEIFGIPVRHKQNILCPFHKERKSSAVIYFIEARGVYIIKDFHSYALKSTRTLMEAIASQALGIDLPMKRGDGLFMVVYRFMLAQLAINLPKIIEKVRLIDKFIATMKKLYDSATKKPILSKYHKVMKIIEAYRYNLMYSTNVEDIFTAEYAHKIVESIPAGTIKYIMREVIVKSGFLKITGKKRIHGTKKSAHVYTLGFNESNLEEVAYRLMTEFLGAKIPEEVLQNLIKERNEEIKRRLRKRALEMKKARIRQFRLAGKLIRTKCGIIKIVHPERTIVVKENKEICPSNGVKIHSLVKWSNFKLLEKLNTARPLASPGLPSHHTV